MTDSQDRNPVEVLADEFVGRFRRGERPALTEYIDKHPELADEIRELFPLLVEMEDVRSIDDSSPSSGSASLKTPDLEQLGDYRMIREIGRGGMGIVYEAEQVSLGRHVAVKVLPKELLENPKQRARFQREAKAAAKLHHTNIVPVFGVGEDEGLGYYVMQFIQGLTLDEVLDELKRMKVTPGSSSATLQTGELQVSRRDVSAADVARSLLTGTFHSLAANDDSGGEPATAEPPPNVKSSARAETPLDDTIAREHEKSRPHTRASDVSTATGRLSDTFALSDSSIVLTTGKQSTSGGGTKKPTYWESIAKIGVQVASALEYAHSQGILHRDIKPGNLLLDLRGAVWVTDFGLAKLDDDRNLTQSGDILGTLRYMAPESFKGETDPRSEVYSLGLTLYELLAFRPACDQTNRHRVIDQVLSAQIEPLNKLNAEIPRDLATIVHKAIDRHPEDRYQTAEALADDLQRFIDDEPIRARPMSSVERFGRWCRRNPVLATATSIAALALMAVAVISTQFAGAQGRAAAVQRELNGQLQNTVEQLDQKTSQLTQTNEEVTTANDRLRAEQERSRQLISQLRRQSAMMAVEKGNQLIRTEDVFPGMLWLTRGLELAEREPNLVGFAGNIRNAISTAQATVPQLVGVVTPDHSIERAAHSQDGRLSALAGALWTSDEPRLKHHITIWDNLTGQMSQRTTLDCGPVSLDFRPDAKTLLICGNGADDKSPFLMTLDVSDGTNQRYELPQSLVPIRAVFGSADFTIQLLAFDLERAQLELSTLTIFNGQVTRAVGRTIRRTPSLHPERGVTSNTAFGKAVGELFPCGFSRDRTVAVTATSRSVMRWDLAAEKVEGYRLAIDDVATGRVYSITLSPNAETLLIDYGKRLSLYRLTDSQLLWEIPFEPGLAGAGISTRTRRPIEQLMYTQRAVVFSSESHALLVYEPTSKVSRSRLEVRSTDTGQLVDAFHDVCRSGRADMAWLSDKGAFVLGTRKENMVFRLPTSGALAINGRFRLGKINQHVGDVVPNFGDEARSFRDIQTGRVRMQLSNDQPSERTNQAFLVTAAGDTLIQRFRSTRRPSTVTIVEIYDSQTGDKRCEYRPQNAWDTKLSPDGRRIAHSSTHSRAARFPARFVDIYDAEDGELLTTIEAVESGRIVELAFSEDSRQLAVAWQRTSQRATNIVNVDVWNLGEQQNEPARRPIWQRPMSDATSTVNWLQFNKQGDKLLIELSTGQVWVLEMDEADRATQVFGKATQAALLPDGEAVVVLDSDGVVQLVDIETRQTFPLRFGGEAPTMRMMLSSDATVLCTTLDSHACPVRCWRMPVAVTGSPAELRSLFETASHTRLTEHGDIELLGSDTAAPPKIPVAQHSMLSADANFISRLESFAVNLLDKQQWASALPQLEHLIEQDPQDLWSRVWRIRCLIELERLEHAESEVEQLAEITPRDPDYATAIAVSLEKRIEELDKTEDEARITALHNLALSTSPAPAKVLRDIAISHIQNGQLELAIEVFRKVIEIDPDDMYAYYSLGSALNMQGKLDEAIDAYQKATQIDPEYESGFYALAYNLKDLGRYAEAAKAYQRAAQLKPNSRNFLGWFESLREDGDLEVALNVVDQIVERFPAYPRTQRFDLLSRLKQWDRAAADVEHIPTTRQWLATPWWVLGPVAKPWGDGASVATELRRWIADSDDAASARWHPQTQGTEAPLTLQFPDAKPDERFSYAVTRVFARGVRQVAVRVSGPVSRIWSLSPTAELETVELVKTDEPGQRALMKMNNGWNTLLAEMTLESADGRCDAQIVFTRDPSDPVQAVVVPGATWRFLHPVDGKDPAEGDPDFHNSFFLPDYDDSRWKEGIDHPGVMGGFGYGDPVGVNIGEPPKGQRYSAYFRHEFDSPFDLEELELRLQRDDGVIVYLNGEEVGRDNMDPIAVESYTLGTAEYGPNGPAETQLRAVRLSGRVVKGRNVLAISLHNSSPGSSDMRFGEVTLEGRRGPTER